MEMMLSERQRALEELLLAQRSLWHPQPFRELRPVWVDALPGLADTLISLDDDETEWLADDDIAARALLGKHLAGLDALQCLLDLPVCAANPSVPAGNRWAWEIPGRKRQQIEAFAAAAQTAGQPVLDWCCGKGHLGRLLALNWRLPVTGLERDQTLCEAGAVLGQRAGVDHRFLAADALLTEAQPQAAQHVVALHACGHLHRRVIRQGAMRGVARFDVAPCCYHLGVDGSYQPFSEGRQLTLTHDDARLAVTETVTAPARDRRRRDREMAWKLAFDAWRRLVTDGSYRNFKPIPSAWMLGSFADFMRWMTAREGLPDIAGGDLDRFEHQGWIRQREVMRYSIVRHAFRRAVEVWLALDLAVFLENASYDVRLGVFCPRQLTPRNLLLSARR